MLLVYHSSCPLPGRIAAVLHLGLLPLAPPPEPDVALDRLLQGQNCAGLLRAQPGLREEGFDSQTGARLVSLGTGAPGWLVENALRSLTAQLGLAEHCWLSQPVGEISPLVRAGAWALLGRPEVSRRGLQRQVLLRMLQRTWQQAALAVTAARRRLGHGPCI